jgi:hypothetical protein
LHGRLDRLIEDEFGLVPAETIADQRHREIKNYRRVINRSYGITPVFGSMLLFAALLPSFFSQLMQGLACLRAHRVQGWAC